MPNEATTPQTGPKPPSSMKAAQAMVDRLKRAPAPTLAELGALIEKAYRDTRPNPGVCHCPDCLSHLAKHGESKLAKAQREEKERNPVP
jgi:hypothetical protein